MASLIPLTASGLVAPLPVLGPLRTPLLRQLTSLGPDTGDAAAPAFAPGTGDAHMPVPLLLIADVGNPVSDLFASPVAVAYLGVLTVLFGFLSYLAYSDYQGKQRRTAMAEERAAAVAEMERILPELREQGKEAEAEAIERELGLLRRSVAEYRRPAAKAAPANKSIFPRLPWQPPPYEPEKSNRFMRRQGLGDEVGAPPPELAKKRRRQTSARRSGAAARRAAKQGQ